MSVDGPLVLSAGPLVAERRPDVLLAAMHIVNVFLVPEATLVLAGPVPDVPFAQTIERYIRRLHPVSARIADPSPEELAVFHDRADVDLDVRDGRFVLAPGGLVLPTHAGPLLLAEAMAELLAVT